MHLSQISHHLHFDLTIIRNQVETGCDWLHCLFRVSHIFKNNMKQTTRNFHEKKHSKHSIIDVIPTTTALHSSSLKSSDEDFVTLLHCELHQHHKLKGSLFTGEGERLILSQISFLIKFSKYPHKYFSCIKQYWKTKHQSQNDGTTAVSI